MFLSFLELSEPGSTEGGKKRLAFNDFGHLATTDWALGPHDEVDFTRIIWKQNEETFIGIQLVLNQTTPCYI